MDSIPVARPIDPIIPSYESCIAMGEAAYSGNYTPSPMQRTTAIEPIDGPIIRINTPGTFARGYRQTILPHIGNPNARVLIDGNEGTMTDAWNYLNHLYMCLIMEHEDVQRQRDTLLETNSNLTKIMNTMSEALHRTEKEKCDLEILNTKYERQVNTLKHYLSCKEEEDRKLREALNNRQSALDEMKEGGAFLNSTFNSVDLTNRFSPNDKQLSQANQIGRAHV